MKLLLDTHTFIWWDSELAKLSPLALALCQDRENVLLLSVASIWEMQIKLQLSKLGLTLPLAEIVETQRQTNNIEILPITLHMCWRSRTCLHITKTPLTACWLHKLSQRKRRS